MGETDMRHKSRERSWMRTGQLQGPVAGGDISISEGIAG